MNNDNLRKLWTYGACLSAILAGCDGLPAQSDPGGSGNPTEEFGVAGTGAINEFSVPPPIAGSGASFAPPVLSGVVVRAETPPPPISGGTLIVTRDGKQLVAADPDRDQVYFIDASSHTLAFVRQLQAGDEPGRVLEDAAGRIHVALRGGRALATLTRDAQSEITRRNVCDLPRGLAYDAARDVLQVACAEGKLVTLPSAPGAAATRVVDIGRDARDVVVRGDQLFVTHFRSAELVSLDASGGVSSKYVPPTFTQLEMQQVSDVSAGGTGGLAAVSVDSTPTTAWRVVDVPGVGVTMLHQRGRTAEVQVQPGGYGSGSCGSGIVQTSITTGLDTMAVKSIDVLDSVLAVDMASDPAGTLLALVAPGNWGFSSQVQLYPLYDGVIDGTNSAMGFSPGLPSGNFASGVPSAGSFAAAPNGAVGSQQPCVSSVRTFDSGRGQATAVVFASGYELAVQEREPAAISFIDTRTGAISAYLDLKQPTRFDTGHAMFHLRAGAGVACASCHSEGGDDGHVWTFHGIGARRTQSLRGGILGTEPFHWNGDMKDFPTLVTEVFVGRMAGFTPSSDQTDELSHWIDRQPSLATQPSDPIAAARGKQLFESDAVACASCHSGAHLTNNSFADVGTGARLQVPSLHGVSFRTPLMHNGCATTLQDRFKPECGGGDKHGHTSQLSAMQIGDLTEYLQTL